ncbi:3'-5' exonuclease [Lichenihabitans sp. Uapishka_5]|uniref:3'-5' exonuclease n=1 Tax=Lichenihabitans sp. Uapishka_5 TaxID=3037302 RepID=UPI0029E7FDC4|nr:3'-5' exonuclease [Lichenihabitans sp. Uapishka_5]MDX7952863.1 3'-5' exonuclease [Lichenihabitans sp. Uapishka_5]
MHSMTKTKAIHEPHEDEMENQALRLERTGRFKILRRIEPATPVDFLGHVGSQLGVFVDVETTGLRADVDEIIEVAMVPFSYSLAGEVLATHVPFSGLLQPSSPIPPAITALTGIDDDAVRGKTMTAADLPSWLGRSSLVLAHNAAFDRSFLEKVFPVFRELRWACSHQDVPWKEEGLKSAGLEAVAASFGFFYTAHRGLDDCWAGVEILGRLLPRSGRTVLDVLLARIDQPNVRLWALGAPYAGKEGLKASGYRWNSGEKGGPKSWYKDFSDWSEAHEEARRLCDEVYGRHVDLPLREISTTDRHSPRSWLASG